jgi:presenilin-like A22 family membrane protease
MKHNIKITIILLAMFILTQFIGLYVVNHYLPQKVVGGEQIEVSAPNLPFGLETPEIRAERDFYAVFPTIIFAFIIAISIFFLLSKFELAFILKLWFFVVIVFALGISLNAFFTFNYGVVISLIVAIILGIFKVYKKNFIIHNLTEFFIYPGIASIFVLIFNLPTIILLLIFISIYDVWAVWDSGIMQKMAKYHINKLNLFPGFFVPYTSKKIKEKIKKIKLKKLKNKKVSVSAAILGGGDIVFPIIAAGVMLKTWGILPALLVTLGATLGLGYLLFFAQKKKFYPAMLYITSGIFIAMGLGYLIFRL